jgi:hypothetical protein
VALAKTFGREHGRRDHELKGVAEAWALFAVTG